MRNTFIDDLLGRAKVDGKIILLSGDIGYGVLDNFAKSLPKQFINFGINEQSMMSAAAGLAHSGLKPIVYSIGNFPTFRCLEQIRNDICYMNLDVTIVAVGAGLAYGTAGYSHHLIEDISSLSGLPNIKIYSPADVLETRFVSQLISEKPGPKYVRLGKGGEGSLTDQFDHSNQGFSVLGENKKMAVVSTGNILSESIKLKLLLGESNPMVVSVFDLSAIDRVVAYRDFEKIIVIEEHILRGGFGSIVLEKAKNRIPDIQRFGINEVNPDIAGSQNFLRRYYRLSAESIFPQVISP